MNHLPFHKRAAIVSAAAAVTLTGMSFAHAATDTSLVSIVNKINTSQTISTQEAEKLRQAAQSNDLRAHLPKGQAQAFARQAARYDLDGVVAAVNAYAAGEYRMADKLNKAAPEVINLDREDSFLASVDYYANEQDQQRREGAELIVIERDGSLLRVDDPVAGENLETVALSCFYRSGNRNPAEGTPPRRVGVDMMLMEEPVRTAILHRNGKPEDWHVHPYEITRLAVDWDASDMMVQAYVYGVSINEQEDARTDRDVAAPTPRWLQYTCSFKDVRYESPTYVPYVNDGW